MVMERGHRFAEDDAGAVVTAALRGGRRTTLVNRNVKVSGHRTSMRLEPAMWDALEEICRREGRSVHEICSLVDARRRESSLTAAMRVFILGYFRAAVTEQGHARAGHGARRAGASGARRPDGDGDEGEAAVTTRYRIPARAP